MDWDDFAQPWLDAADELEIAHHPVQQALMDAARLAPGEHVLDVGCGTGPGLLAALRAVGPDGRVAGIDIAPPLLARAAERLYGTVELLHGDAGSYAYPVGQPFDVILSNFGMMFFDDTAAALAHLRRTVRPGGRLAATVWGRSDRNPWFALPRQCIDRLIPEVPRPDSTGPGPMRFGDPTPFVAALVQTGWRPHVKTLTLLLTPQGSPEAVAALHMKVTAGMMLRGLNMSEVTLAKVEADIAKASAEHLIGSKVHVPAEIHVITAVAA